MVHLGISYSIEHWVSKSKEGPVSPVWAGLAANHWLLGLIPTLTGITGVYYESYASKVYSNCTIFVPRHTRSNFYDILWNFKVFFFLQWNVSISKASVCYTRNKFMTSYMKKKIFSDTPQAKMLVPRARFFTLTQYYVNNTQTGT